MVYTARTTARQIAASAARQREAERIAELRLRYNTLAAYLGDEDPAVVAVWAELSEREDRAERAARRAAR